MPDEILARLAGIVMHGRPRAGMRETDLTSDDVRSVACGNGPGSMASPPMALAWSFRIATVVLLHHEEL